MVTHSKNNNFPQGSSIFNLTRNTYFPRAHSNLNHYDMTCLTKTNDLWVRLWSFVHELVIMKGERELIKTKRNRHIFTPNSRAKTSIKSDNIQKCNIGWTLLLRWIQLVTRLILRLSSLWPPLITSFTIYYVYLRKKQFVTAWYNQIGAHFVLTSSLIIKHFENKLAGIN